MDLAVDYHRSGDLSRAEAIYREILSNDPLQPDALNLLGVIALQCGNSAAAAELIAKAIAQNPHNAEFHNNLGVALRDLNRLMDAEESFRAALQLRSGYARAHNNLGIALQMRGKTQQALMAYSDAVAADPGFAEAHNNRAAACQILGQHSEAIKSLEMALKLDPAYGEAFNNLGGALTAQAEEDFTTLRNRALECYEAALRHLPDDQQVQWNLHKLYHEQVPRWHFPMLNDAARNSAFDRAIRKAVTPGCTVLDIGTGSGLLSMMAARAGASRVYTCEVVECLAETARAIIDDNSFNECIEVFGKSSTELVIGDDIPDKVDVLVTETAAVGLLGERMLETLSHAQAELIKPNARIIPVGATVYAILVESADLVSLDRVGTVSGFDLRRFNKFSASPKFREVRLRNTEFTPLCRAFEVFSFRFDGGAMPERQVDLTIRIEDGGYPHAFVFWFNLHLDDEVSIGTGPHDSDTHWEQAVQILPDSPYLASCSSAQVRAYQDGIRIWFELG